MKKRLTYQVQAKLKEYFFQREQHFEKVLALFLRQHPSFQEKREKYFALLPKLMKAKLMGNEAVYAQLQEQKENIKKELRDQEEDLIQKGFLPFPILENDQAYLKAWEPYLPAFNLEALKLKFYHNLLPEPLKILMDDEAYRFENLEETHLDAQDYAYFQKIKRMVKLFLEEHLYKNKQISPPSKINIPGNLYLCGKVGAGKTHLAKVIAADFLRNGKFVAFYSSADCFKLLDQLNFLKKSFYQNDLEEKINALEDELEDVYEADLLVIDDLGTESLNKKHTQEYLLDILKRRKEQKLPTLITSNLLPSDLQKTFDERISSRIQGDFFVVRFEFLDFRTYTWHRSITGNLKEREQE